MSRTSHSRSKSKAKVKVKPKTKKAGARSNQPAKSTGAKPKLAVGRKAKRPPLTAEQKADRQRARAARARATQKDPEQAEWDRQTRKERAFEQGLEERNALRRRIPHIDVEQLPDTHFCDISAALIDFVDGLDEHTRAEFGLTDVDVEEMVAQGREVELIALLEAAPRVALLQVMHERVSAVNAGRRIEPAPTGEFNYDDAETIGEDMTSVTVGRGGDRPEPTSLELAMGRRPHRPDGPIPRECTMAAHAAAMYRD